MRKSLELQAELGPVFDITLDCEDGAPVGGEIEHAQLIAELAEVGRQPLRPRRRARAAGRPPGASRRRGDTLVGRAGARLAYLMVPKPRGLADLQRAVDAIDMRAARRRGAADARCTRWSRRTARCARCARWPRTRASNRCPSA